MSQRSVEDAPTHHVAHRHEAERDRRLDARPAPVPARPAPEIRDQSFWVHRTLRRAGAARGVDEQPQRVVIVVGNELRCGRQRLPAFEQLGQGLHQHRAARFGQPRPGGIERFALVVHLGAVVEHDQPRRRVARQHQFDGVAEIVDARSEYARFGLCDDGPQLADRCAGLQRNGHRAQLDQRHVDGRVVHTREAQHTDAVAWLDRMPRAVGQCAGDRADALPQLAIRDGLEPGQKLKRSAAGLRICGEVDSAFSDRRPLRIGPHDGAHDPRQPQPGLLDRCGQCLDGPGIGELGVGGVQIGDAAREPLFAGIGRHEITSPSERAQLVCVTTTPR